MSNKSKQREIPIPHCILIGNPREGFRVIGPFDSREDASDYLESDPTEGLNMWVIEMDMPDAPDCQCVEPGCPICDCDGQA